jgi:hypothetical protein
MYISNSFITRLYSDVPEFPFKLCPSAILALRASFNVYVYAMLTYKHNLPHSLGHITELQRFVQRIESIPGPC